MLDGCFPSECISLDTKPTTSSAGQRDALALFVPSRIPNGAIPLTISEREVVAALGEAITQRIGEPRYNLWFANKTRFRCEDDRLVIGVANHFYQEWLQKTFADDLRAAAADVLGRPMQVRFVIDPELFQ